MSNKIRSIAGRLNTSVTALLSAKRCRAQLPIAVSLAEQPPARAMCSSGSAVARNSAARSIVEGFTQDFNRAEISFVVPVIRLDEHYLAGHDEKLTIEISLPSGKQIQMRAAAARYERIERKLAVYDYLVAARIVAMSETDRQIYEDFLDRADDFLPTSEKKPDQPKRTLVSQFFSLF